MVSGVTDEGKWARVEGDMALFLWLNEPLLPGWTLSTKVGNMFTGMYYRHVLQACATGMCYRHVLQTCAADTC